MLSDELDDLMTQKLQNELQPFHAMEILARAQELEAQGRHICHLELGEPAVPASPLVRQAVAADLANPQRYTHSKGRLTLRQGLAGYYVDLHGVEIDPERIVITMGSSSAFLLTFLAGFQSGARIAVTRPGYPAYLNILNGLGFEACEIEVTAKSGWRLSAADIEAAHRKNPLDGLLFASPANPTGACVDRRGLEDIVSVCARLNIRLISDEIYHGLRFEGADTTASSFTNQAFIINSFSKFYCMTGWRVGWVVVPKSMVRTVEILQQSLFISPSSVGQTAALAALDDRAYGDAQLQQNRIKRDLLVAGLSKIGFDEVRVPDGAFYIYTNISKFADDAQEFCLELLNEAGVALTPGVDFDRVNGRNFVRLSFAGPQVDIELAIERMGAFLVRPS